MPSRALAMRFSVDVPWHRHVLEVHWLSAHEARGFVVVDWTQPPAPPPTSSPQLRQGEADHHGAEASGHVIYGDVDARPHRVPFEAAIGEDGGWRFEVIVGTALPRRYRFTLFPVDDALVGVVDVALHRDSAQPRSLGVVAR